MGSDRRFHEFLLDPRQYQIVGYIGAVSDAARQATIRRRTDRAISALSGIRATAHMQPGCEDACPRRPDCDSYQTLLMESAWRLALSSLTFDLARLPEDRIVRRSAPQERRAAGTIWEEIEMIRKVLCATLATRGAHGRRGAGRRDHRLVGFPERRRRRPHEGDDRRVQQGARRQGQDRRDHLRMGRARSTARCRPRPQSARVRTS